MKAKASRIPLAVIAAVEAVYAEIPPVECKGLCQECCSPVGDLMTAVERDRITERTGKVPNGAIDRAHGVACTMLDAKGRCSVYEIRPTICRVWGADAEVRCPYGCPGAGKIPYGFGRDYITAVRKVARAY